MFAVGVVFSGFQQHLRVNLRPVEIGLCQTFAVMRSARGDFIFVPALYLHLGKILAEQPPQAAYNIIRRLACPSTVRNVSAPDGRCPGRACDPSTDHR